MTTAAICATRKVSCSRSFYRAEQYDQDLGLYYLRARYYNPVTGRFMSRDPKECKPLESRNKPVDSRKLHKYLYASGDPVNLIDPRGREDEEDEGFLYTEIGPTTEEIKKFIAGPVLCAFAIDAYLISLRDGGNALDNTLGGAGAAAGCEVLLAGW
jgi:RHS repeat-associated protein